MAHLGKTENQDCPFKHGNPDFFHLSSMNIRIASIIAAAYVMLVPSLGLSARGVSPKTAASYNITDNDMIIYAPGISDTVRLFVISDTHLWRSDAREDEYRQYSQRMAGAYNKTKHFQTGDLTNPEEQMRQSLRVASDFGADAVIHLGDLLSYPSESAAEWAKAQFDACGIPWYYIPGNHDWHYEGMEGSEDSLRNEWCPKRLAALMQGYDFLNYAVTVKGVKVILVGDGINEVLPSQVKFLRQELKSGTPSLLMMHVPIYTPGRQDDDFTIGNPRWGAAIDKNYKIERRPQWPENHSRADYDFYDTAISYGPRHGLLGIVAGHVHFPSCSVQNGIPTLTVDDNASGGYLRITIVPVD